MTGSQKANCRALSMLLASTAFAWAGAAQAQDQEPAPESQPAASAEQDAQAGSDIIVTAQKRAENLQDVPIAITAFGTKTLEDTQVDAFDDYAKMVPSLSYKSAGPGFSNVYFRGVASGENANHSTSLPSVGTYLDEQPITTITGALDLHIFDIERVEALAGPQGTLYGASSQAGTVRIITNKPDLGSTYGQVSVEVNKIAHGDFVAAENSMGFHAPQEAAMVLGEAIDFARQGELAARAWNQPQAMPPAGRRRGFPRC